MLTFIVSVRAQALANDWRYHTWLLERTVDSLLAQTDPNFNVVIVCHDVPPIRQIGMKGVHILPVEFAVPARRHQEMCADKVFKITRGVQWAIDAGADYVMYVDADDLVSRRLSEFVAGQKRENGWIFESGFSYRYSERWLRRQRNHHLICGTCAIVATRLLRSARDDHYQSRVVDTLAAAGHHRYAALLNEQGTPLKPLPFPGAVYVIHEDSTQSVVEAETNSSTRHDTRPAWRKLLSMGRRAQKGLDELRPLTAGLRTEFTVSTESYDAAGIVEWKTSSHATSESIESSDVI